MVIELQTELRMIASRQMAHERAGHTLQPTALVNEAYLRLRGQRNLAGMSRADFLKAASVTMRRLLIDHARAHMAKGKGDHKRVTLSNADVTPAEPPVDLLDLEDALQKLEQDSPRMAQVVTCRYFGGMTMAEISESLGVGLRTVDDDWAFAKAWLRRQLSK
jgi:RNA polymerase sigma-70 factor, ECF subfamily